MKRVFILLTALWPLCAQADSDSAPPQEQTAGTALVSTIRLRAETAPLFVTAYGSIGAGTALTTITLPADGIVTQILVTPGGRVTAGQALARITPTPSSRVERRKDEDALQAAQAGYAHMQSLFASRLATSADLAIAGQALRDATATLDAAKAAGIGATRDVTAPADGVITAISVAPGTQQAAGAALFSLAPANALAAQVGAPAAAIRQGEAATLTLLNSGATLQAEVAQGGAALDPQTGLVDVTLSFTGAAMPGEPVSAQIETGSVTGYAVPRDAVQTDEAGDYVFQLDPRNTAHRETVKILGRNGNDTIIAPTLDAAMPLVTTGAYQLDDGMGVRLAGASS